MGWFQNIPKEKKDSLFELYILLKTIDRFFVIENLSISDRDHPNRNFYDELLVAKDVILRIISIIESLIPEDEKNSYWFRKYAEQRFANNVLRDTLREELYRQDSPEKGLLLLYDTFVNIKTLIFDLLKTQNIPYISYKNIGDLLSREIRENQYFNPFKRPLIIEIDMIENEKIADTVKAIEDKSLKRYVSISLIALLRILKILRYVVTDSSEQAVVNKSIAILFFLRSELEDLRRFFENAPLQIEGKLSAEGPAGGLRSLMKGLSYQISMEIKRVYLQELRDITRRTGQKRQRGRIENSAGIIKNLTEQGIIQIAQIFNPDLRGEELFPSFVTKKQLSLKLREDIAVMHRLVSSVLEELLLRHQQAKATVSESSTVTSPPTGNRISSRNSKLIALRDYIHYFQSFTYRLLRYDDFEEFSNFIEEILKYIEDNTASSGTEMKFYERLAHFKIFLETLLRQVSQREELIGENLDEERVMAIVESFLKNE
jgi:hypothetical protein